MLGIKLLGPVQARTAPKNLLGILSARGLATKSSASPRHACQGRKSVPRPMEGYTGERYDLGAGAQSPRRRLPRTP